MINIKTEEEIKIMQKGGKILAEVLQELLKYVKPGVSELEVDALAEKLIIKKGGLPGFKRVPGYKHSICVATNDVVVHGIPSQYRFKQGDVVCIDCGVFYEGFHTDMAETVKIQNSEDRIDQFISTGKKALNEAIKQARPGNRIGHISKTIQDIVEGDKYSIVRSLIGHGVGKKLHEDPEVPNYGKRGRGTLLQKGLVIAIEPMINLGKKEVVQDEDGWTVKTADGKFSAHYEHTIAVGNGKADILTTFKYIEEALKEPVY